MELPDGRFLSFPNDSESEPTPTKKSKQCATDPEASVGQHGSSGAGAPDTITNTTVQQIGTIQNAALEVCPIPLICAYLEASNSLLVFGRPVTDSGLPSPEKIDPD